MGAVAGMELRHAVEGAVTKKILLFSRAVRKSDGDVSALEAVRFADLGSFGEVWGGSENQSSFVFSRRSCGQDLRFGIARGSLLRCPSG